MKNYIIIPSLFVFIFSGCQSGNKIQIPENVKAKFASIYPKADHPEWEMEDGNYEASFKEEKMETSVIISSDGNVVETESEMDSALLPQPVHDYITSQLGGKKISSAVKIVSATGMISYEAEVGETDYLFDSNGQFTGKEEEEKGKDGDKD